MAKSTAARAASVVNAPAVHVPKKGHATVVVGCKVPVGLALQLFRKTQVPEPVQGGGVRITDRYDRFGEVIEVRGPAYPEGPAPKGYPRRPVIIGGYAITRDVPANFWDEWLEQNKDTELVKSRQIIAWASADDVKAEAQENRTRTSGLEPLNQDGDPRMSRPLNPNVRSVERAPEMAEREGGIKQYDDTE